MYLLQIFKNNGTGSSYDHPDFFLWQIRQLDETANRLMQTHPETADQTYAKQKEINEEWTQLTAKANSRKEKLLDSYDLQRFLSDYRDLMSWINSMMGLVSSDELANDVTGAEALLERHQVRILLLWKLLQYHPIQFSVWLRRNKTFLAKPRIHCLGFPCCFHIFSTTLWWLQAVYLIVCTVLWPPNCNEVLVSYSMFCRAPFTWHTNQCKCISAIMSCTFFSLHCRRLVTWFGMKVAWNAWKYHL